MILCAVSGEPVQSPVLSPRSHRIFERSVIEAYIRERGCDPITKEALAIEELMPLDLGIEPMIAIQRSPAQAGIPALLAALRVEFDAVALDAYELRRQNSQLREKLSEALYKCDAAVRVIARITSERDEAREALSLLAPRSSADRLKMDEEDKDKDKDKAEDVDDKSEATEPTVDLEQLEFQKHIGVAARRLRTQRINASRPEVSVAECQKIEGTHLAANFEATLVRRENGSVRLLADRETELLPASSPDFVGLALGPGLAMAAQGFSLIISSNSYTQAISLPSVASAVAAHPSGLAAALCTGDLLFYDTRGNMKHCLSLAPEPSKASPLQFTADGDYAVYSTEHATVFYALEQGVAAATHEPAARAIAASENGYCVAWIGNGHVWMKDLRSNDPPIDVCPVSSSKSLSFDPSGSLLAVAGDSKIWRYAKRALTEFDSTKAPDSGNILAGAIGVAWGAPGVLKCAIVESSAHGLLDAVPDTEPATSSRKKKQPAAKSAAKQPQPPQTRMTRSRAAQEASQSGDAVAEPSQPKKRARRKP